MLPAATANFVPLRLSAPDARADGAQRQISLHAKHVHIRRQLAGITMNIAVLTKAYHGVLLSLVQTPTGAFAYRVNLVHKDPELDIVLTEGLDEAIMTDQWRAWSQNLALPRLVERKIGEYTMVDASAPTSHAPTFHTPTSRGPAFHAPTRRRRANLNRRSRFACRRKIGQA